ncbi:hypothetical protein [Tahibacter soli]|uniref:Uncharacterized protein n=1 Tax=Tahibacter soli TaxID=2983605 RepID=A0A9X4BL66_9GAMM|nr:hypothetical protein [Tahibacter soli]MDC8013904.1 hypothetical protein [Tahibacter soli]
MHNGNIGKRGLGKRLAQMILAVAFAAFASAGAFASNALGVAIDPAFGANGFTALPRYPTADPGTTVAPIGIAHLDVAGGYMVATLQRVSGNDRMVLTRYTESGAIDAGWAFGGSQLPGLPVPYTPGGSLNAIKLVAGKEAGQDIFYLAFSLFSSPDFYVAVAKFRADGSFDPNFGVGGYVSSRLPVSAPAGLLTVGGAAFTEVFGQPVLVVAVTGKNNRLVFTRAHGSGAGALSDQGGGSALTMLATPNILQMRGSGLNHVELVGSVANDALYMDYDAGTLVARPRVFRLPCPAGSNWSAVDAIARPGAFVDDALVAGRSSCIGQGVTSMVARVQNIVNAPVFPWTAVTETNTTCNGTGPCIPVVFAYDDAHPDYALTVTPGGNIAPVRVADGATLSTFLLSNVGGASYPIHSTYRGTVFRWPRLVGFGVILPSSEAVSGLVIDGLFSDGFD